MSSERLRVLIDWIGEHLAEVEVNDKIAEDVRSGMEKQQKEFLLRQQMAAIRKELGEATAPDLPMTTEPHRGRRPAREGAGGRVARGRQAGTHQ